MNLIETLVSKATEEACELGKAFSKLNFKGIKAVDSETGAPLVLDAIKQMNEILAVVELLRDRGVPMAGIGDPVAIGEAKNLIVQDMEEAMKAGTLALTEDDQDPRPEGVNEAGAGLPEDGEGEGDGQDGEGLGEDGTGPDGDDGAAGGDGDDGLGGDGEGGDGTDGEGGDGEGEGGDEGEGSGDGSDDDSGSGDDGDGEGEGDDGDGSDSEEEEEEDGDDEPGSNDV